MTTPHASATSGEDPGTVVAARDLAGKAVLYGLGTAAVKGMAVFLLPVITRYLSPAEYGQVAGATAVTAALALVLPLCLHASLPRLYHDAADETGRRETIWTLWAAIAGASGALALILDAGGGVLLQPLFRDVPFRPILRVALWTSFAATFALLPQALLQVRERAAVAVLLSVAGAAVSLTSVLVLVVGLGRGAAGYLTGLLLGAAAAALPGTWIALRSCRFRFRTDVLRKALAYSLPLIPHGLAGWLLAQGDRLVLERFRPLEEVGVYLVAAQLAGALTLATGAASTAWAPFLFRIHARMGDGAKGLLVPLTTGYALGVAGLSLALGLLARPAVALMAGPAYLGAAELIPWMAAALLFGGLYYVPANFLFLVGRTGWVSLGTLAAGALTVGLDLWLVPRHGLSGAVWASVAGNLALLAIVWAAARRAFPFPYAYGRLVRIGAAAAAVAAASLLLPRLPLAADTALRAALWLLFPALLLLTGFFGPEERSLLRRILRGKADVA